VCIKVLEKKGAETTEKGLFEVLTEELQYIQEL